MRTTARGAGDNTGGTCKTYEAGGVYDAPSSIPLRVAEVFMGLGYAERLDTPPQLETKDGPPPGPLPPAKPPEQQLDAPRRRGRRPGRR